MKTTALIEKGKDGRFTVFTPELEHVIIGTGECVENAKNDFFNSKNEVYNSYIEEGENIPEELLNLSFIFKYDIASLFNYYPFINMSRFAEKSGINASLMRQYKSGQYISEKQVSKIEKTLHQIGRELSEIKLI